MAKCPYCSECDEIREVVVKRNPELEKVRAMRLGEIGINYKPKKTSYGYCLNTVRYWDETLHFLHCHPAIDAHRILEGAIAFRADESERETKHTESHGNMKPVIDYCLSHKLPPNTDRRSKLFKNVAVYMENSGMNEKQMQLLDAEIIANCPGRKRGEIMAWIPWVKRGRHEINWKEISDVARMVDKDG